MLRQRHPLADRRGTLVSLLFVNTAPFCGPFLGPFGSSSCARFELFSIVNAVQILVFHTYSASMFCVSTSGLLNEIRHSDSFVFLRNMAPHSLIDIHSIMRATFIVPFVPFNFRYHH
jgi:hypothetical protein